MILAKVAGTVVSTQKVPKMEGMRFLVLQQVDTEGKPTGGSVIAADAVNAGIGEYVPFMPLEVLQDKLISLTKCPVMLL